MEAGGRELKQLVEGVRAQAIDLLGHVKRKRALRGHTLRRMRGVGGMGTWYERCTCLFWRESRFDC